MSVWKEVEKQVIDYAHWTWVGNKTIEQINALANIKGIIEALESQIPKVYDHGVSMQEQCEKCGMPEAPSPEYVVKAFDESVTKWENLNWRQINKDMDDYVALASQNERIAELSERINKHVDISIEMVQKIASIENRMLEFQVKCEDNWLEDLSKRIQSLEDWREDGRGNFTADRIAGLENSLAVFAAMCEENGKKREKRIRTLEEFTLDVQVLFNSCSAMEKRIKALENWRLIPPTF